MQSLYLRSQNPITSSFRRHNRDSVKRSINSIVIVSSGTHGNTVYKQGLIELERPFLLHDEDQPFRYSTFRALLTFCFRSLSWFLRLPPFPQDLPGYAARLHIWDLVRNTPCFPTRYCSCFPGMQPSLQDVQSQAAHLCLGGWGLLNHTHSEKPACAFPIHH